MTPEEKAATAQISAHAVVTINDVVERVSQLTRHRVKWFLTPLGRAAEVPMSAVNSTHTGIHGLIRHGVQGIGQLTAQTLLKYSDSAAASLTEENSRGIENLVALGAAFGDSLPDALSPSMTFHGPEDIGTADTVAVFVHGLGGHEQQWSIDYAMACAVYGAIPVFARYTTGKAIDVNAAELDEQMRHLCTNWSGGSLRRIILVGHSMGGLVITRALALNDTGSRWSPLVTDVVTLGSPFTGAPLEQASNYALNSIIRYSPTAAPIAELGHQRSAGIKDLGYGVREPIPGHVTHTAVVAAVGSDSTNLVSRVVGDGMVPTSSARGPHHTAANVRVVSVPESHHWSLTGHPFVTELLVDLICSSGLLIQPSTADDY